jgi:DNA-binding NtrC family response regulator
MPAPFRPHLLVVDDEACIREALIAALGATYVVHAAASGAEACALLEAHPIAGIILDVLLGDEHGLDLIPDGGHCHVMHVVAASPPPGPATPVWLRRRVAS